MGTPKKSDDDVSFEDPVAICKSKKEVQEVFRVLQRYLDPIPITKPICVDVKPKGNEIELTYSLNQQYLNGRIQLWSLLIVTAHLQPIPELLASYESEFVITKLEERWNGIHPHPFISSSNYIFWIVKRINGMLSWNVTKTFLS